MKESNQRLDDILQQNIQFILLGEFPSAVPDHNNWVNVMGRVYSFDFTVAKQALTSITKELVAEAKPAHVHGTTVSSGQFNRGVSEFEQNLLKALEEV
jgi:hypothetical protein